jgi:hypothetical protein
MPYIITHMHDGKVSVEHHDCPLGEPKEPIKGKFGTTYFFNDRREASQRLYQIYRVEQEKLKKRYEMWNEKLIGGSDEVCD